MQRLKLPINEHNTRCLRCPEEPLEFLGYRIGCNYRVTGKGPYIDTRPSKASVQGICRKVSWMTTSKNTLIPTENMVERLNLILSGWANIYDLGQDSPTYRSIDEHTITPGHVLSVGQPLS